MRDNTNTHLDRGPKGADERVRTVETARQIVEATNLHAAGTTLPGRRPAHTAGVFLVGRFWPSPESEPFTSLMFEGGPTGGRTIAVEPKWVLARFSPLRTVDESGRFDLHGLSVRVWSGGNDADYTDLVAINTQPFMFRTADEFETVTRLLRSNSLKDKVNALFEFATATVAGDASIHGLAKAIEAARRGDEPLLGRSYWGIHTFFAGHRDPSSPTDAVRVPYRYQLTVRDDEGSPRGPSSGRILAKYRDLVKRVDDGYPVTIDLSFTLPWRWEQLTNWNDVPEQLRLDLINPQAVWKTPEEFPMGKIVLHSVVDGGAAWGLPTDEDCDALLFDPTKLTKGLNISEDPMLIALSSIYAESHMRRT